jgi:peroxiredoxin family protein
MIMVVPVLVGLVITLAALAIPGAMDTADSQPPRPARDFVVNLTSDQPARAMMALELAAHAVADGRRVTVFLNVEAARLAAADAGDSDFQTLFQKVRDEGVSFLACPMCMQRFGVEPDTLADGVVVADRERLFGRLGPDATVFSY